MSNEIATIAKTCEILEKYDLYPKKNFGQNFIIEPEIVRHIAEYAQIDDNTLVMEIGPGIGALTEQLAKRANHVVAYEIDNKLLDVLAESLAEYSNIDIIGCDFLKRDIKKDISELKKNNQKFAICANLPYYVTTPIIFHIIDSQINPDSMTFMVQKEMAERFCAKVNSEEYNGLSVILQYLYEIKIVMKVPSTVFLPKPKVESIVIRFTPKNPQDINDFAKFNEFIKACFIQRRKTIYNNLKEYFKDDQKAHQVLLDSKIDEKRRAESLEINDFIRLFKAI